MSINKPNFTATIHFTVGLEQSATITKIEESWIKSNEICDVVENDLTEEGATSVLECVGINLNNEGSFVVEVFGHAKYDETPDYEIIKQKEIIAHHEVTSERKDTEYEATVLLFDSVKQMAMHKIGGWGLYSSHTDTANKYYITEYRNGKMFIRAVSYGNAHIYSFGEIENDQRS